MAGYTFSYSILDIYNFNDNQGIVSIDRDGSFDDLAKAVKGLFKNSKHVLDLVQRRPVKIDGFDHGVSIRRVRVFHDRFHKDP